MPWFMDNSNRNLISWPLTKPNWGEASREEAAAASLAAAAAAAYAAQERSKQCGHRWQRSMEAACSRFEIELQLRRSF